jgi:hypothetical protein
VTSWAQGALFGFAIGLIVSGPVYVAAFFFVWRDRRRTQ